jgi:hypothetical protein
MELFRVVVKSGIIYFTTPKDIRVTVVENEYYNYFRKGFI